MSCYVMFDIYLGLGLAYQDLGVGLELLSLESKPAVNNKCITPMAETIDKPPPYAVYRCAPADQRLQANTSAARTCLVSSRCLVLAATLRTVLIWLQVAGLATDRRTNRRTSASLKTAFHYEGLIILLQ